MENEPKFSPKEFSPKDKDFEKFFPQDLSPEEKELVPYVVKEIEKKIEKEGVDEGEINKILESSALSKEEAILSLKEGLVANELYKLRQEKKEIEKNLFSVAEREEAISAWKERLVEKYKKSESEDKEK